MKSLKALHHCKKNDHCCCCIIEAF